MSRYCMLEHARFPDAAFSAVAGVGLVHVNDLAAGTPRHTIGGDILPSEASEGSPEEKARKVRDRILRKGSTSKGEA
jgi:hypothetical protein